MNNYKDKLRAIFYGPSWLPGKPRLGLDEDKIQVLAKLCVEVTFTNSKTVFKGKT